MKNIKAYPPNWPTIAKAFPVIKGKPSILYAYGDVLYNPSGVVLSPWIEAHENVHSRRQLGEDGDETMSPERWWDYYLAYEDFRYKEELLAHRAEWESFKAVHEDAVLRGRYLDAIAQRLSSPMYGSMVTLSKAYSDILEV